MKAKKLIKKLKKLAEKNGALLEYEFQIDSGPKHFWPGEYPRKQIDLAAKMQFYVKE